ncbi:MAG: M50 family metallopeptidase [Defluviitaleaceae bacterium]|nr:M50 family metallopeptidase [Defluviitaleaceae bacterium]
MAFIKKYQNILGCAAILLLVGGILAGVYFRGRAGAEFVEYNYFMGALEDGRVEAVNMGSGAIISFSLAGEAGQFSTNNPRREGFKEMLLLQGVTVTEASPGDAGFLQIGITLALVAGLGLLLYRRSGMAKAKSGLSPVMVNVAAGEAACDFRHVAGNLEAKESVKDIVDYLKRPEKFAKYGARMPRGILFHGKPGTGKTLMARAMAGEAGVPFYAVSGSDFVQMYVGVGAARVRDLFKKAREAGSGVIFIDEIDALGKKRSDGLNGNDEREQTLNALLTEMQGFAESAGIVVVAATNRPDTLDEALLRPGRLDRRVEIGLPDITARRQIIDLHAKGKPMGLDVDLAKLATDTVFFSGAMLEGLLNDAAINAARRNARQIEASDITAAYYTALAGSEKKDRSQIRQEERMVTAWHEAGHAIAATLVGNRVAKVTIIPSTSGAGGFCVNIPQERMYYTKTDLRQQMMVSLAGRAAEEIKFGSENITTGASNDIEKATATAMQYVAKFGMGTEIVDLTMLKQDEKIASETAALVREVYESTLEIMRENANSLEAVAEMLLENETVDGDDVGEILAAA